MSTMPYFLIPIAIGLIAQISKRFFNKKWMSEMEIGHVHLPRYGGMPSAHAAFVFSLATVIALVDGISSGTFAIAAAAIILILDDALRMRIFLGRHGAALRDLIKKLPTKDQETFPHLETRLGHKPVEVIAGALLGILLTLLIFFLLP